mgnify:FL=1
MKKLLSIIAAFLICMGTQAQIVSSRSSIVRTEKQSSNTQWFVRGGMNLMNLSGDAAEDLKSKMGYNVMLGFTKNLGAQGAYWGMDFGLTSRGFKVEGEGDDIKSIAHAVQVSPFTFGWEFDVTDAISIDPHIGAFVSCDYTSKMKGDGEDISWSDFADYSEVDYNRFDAGLNLGVGVWYDRFNLDFSYQRGFIDVFTDLDGVKSSNFMIRLGVAF